jgi:transcriptional regulator GlxA family with amidase domain
LTTQAQPETTVAFVLYPEVTPLDLIGPLQVFTTLGSFAQLGLPVPPTRTVVVGERIEAMDSDTPVKLTPSTTFDQLPHPDIVIVPGGGMRTVRAAANEAILHYVRSAANTAQVCASVCTGALVLAAAGLLEGRPATTHWAYWRLLERLGARYVPEQRWVEDGKFITSAGVSAGIDMALYLTERLTDEATARMVQLGIEYDPKPPHGGIHWSTVDWDIYAPVLAQQLPAALADKPELLHRLTG